METLAFPVKICVNQFFGNCPDCKIDRDPSHHPNNLDCWRYKEMTVWGFEVEDKGKDEDLVHKLD